jgi:hypothetical protein
MPAFAGAGTGSSVSGSRTTSLGSPVLRLRSRSELIGRVVAYIGDASALRGGKFGQSPFERREGFRQASIRTRHLVGW